MRKRELIKNETIKIKREWPILDGVLTLKISFWKIATEEDLKNSSSILTRAVLMFVNFEINKNR